jgi:hypothetical protein
MRIMLVAVGASLPARDGMSMVAYPQTSEFVRNVEILTSMGKDLSGYFPRRLRLHNIQRRRLRTENTPVRELCWVMTGTLARCATRIEHGARGFSRTDNGNRC